MPNSRKSSASSTSSERRKSSGSSTSSEEAREKTEDQMNNENSDELEPENDAAPETDPETDADLQPETESEPKSNVSEPIIPQASARSASLDHDEIPEHVDVSNLDHVLAVLVSTYESETKLLSTAELHEYEGKSSLEAITNKSLQSLQKCMKVVENTEGTILMLLGRITAFNDTLEKKIKDVKLESWIKDDMIEPSDVHEEIQFQKTKQMTSAAERVQRMSELAESSVRCSELTAQLAERANKASGAINEAREAAIQGRERYEKAKIAEEEKRKFEEEARRKAEEKRRKQEEEERLRLEREEERRREEERIKGTPEEQELKRRRDEEEKRERERRDPRNWPKTSKSKLPGSGFEDGPTCVIRAMECENLKEEDMVVEVKDQMHDIPSLNPNDEIVSDIISIEPADMENNFKLEEPWAIAIRHCAQRNIAREPVVLRLTNDGAWEKMGTQEVHFDDWHGQKFAETRIKDLYGIFVVVSTVKTDHYQVGKKGNKTNSSVDSRISINWPPNALKVTLDLILQVQPVESHLISELKVKQKDLMANVTSTSHIINMEIAKKRTLKPVTISLPVPLNSAKKSRPATAPNKSKAEVSSGRPTTAYHASDSSHDGDEELHIIFKAGPSAKWKEMKGIEPTQQKNKDIVSFDINQVEPLRLMGLRTKSGVSEEGLARVANCIEEAFTDRSVCFILRQKNDDQMDIVIQAVPSSRVDRALRQLHEEGFDEDGPVPSKEVGLTERQKLEVRFRGNVKVEKHDVPIPFLYNSQLPNRLNLYVTEEDKFAQKSLDCYRGFAQIYTTKKCHKTVVRDEGGVKKQAVEVKEEDVLLCELLINIPKSDTELYRPKPKAEFQFLSNDSVTLPYIQQLAQNIGGEWTQLAVELGLSKPRIQAIKRNNTYTSNNAMVVDMLMTWIKKLPTSARKAKPLLTALERCGRPELAEELRDQERDFQNNKKR